MSFKTLLVCLNDISRNKPLLEASGGLARDFDAHITGLYVIPAVEVYPSAGFEAMPVVFEGHRDYFKEKEASVRSLFETAVAKEDCRGGFRVLESQPNISGVVIEQGREADLVIVSQADPIGSSTIGSDFVERVSISTGRPTLAIPRKGRTKVAPELVIVGWNATRESARAVFDSIPLLKRAKEVRIVWVDPQKEFPEGGVLPGAEIAEALSRHGINAVVEGLPWTGNEAGEALLMKVNDTGAGLLVMGAYGHTRLREFILGGATRSVLKGMNCPIFFSH